MDKKLGSYLSKLDKIVSRKSYFGNPSSISGINVKLQDGITFVEATDGHIAIQIRFTKDIGLEPGVYDIDTWKNLVCKGYDGKPSVELEDYPPFDRIIPDKKDGVQGDGIFFVNLSLLSKVSPFVEGSSRFQISRERGEAIRVDGISSTVDTNVIAVFMPMTTK